MSPNPTELVALQEETERKRSLFTPTHTVERPCENIARRQSSARQEESPHWKLTLLNLDLGLLDSKNKFLLFKPCSPQYFIMAVQAE